jgi:nicotinate-nucleotide pyrophosphorylase (carboxylating)
VYAGGKRVEGLDSNLIDVVRRALEEDAAGDDVTTRILVGERVEGRAVITVRAAGVASGQKCARAVFSVLDGSMEYEVSQPDGSSVRPGDIIAVVRGNLRAILSGERTALNLLQHLSGVATLTRSFVEKVRGTGATILDTRKTTPGLRALEKEAVLHGGGKNHRADLAGLILVKDNHITAAGGLDAVIRCLGERLGDAEIEVTSIEELRRFSNRPPLRIMLDNFDPSSVERALQEMKGWKHRPQVEVSGGVTIDTVGEYALNGVDFISIGSLTSSAPALDMSLSIEGGEEYGG